MKKHFFSKTAAMISTAVIIASCAPTNLTVHAAEEYAARDSFFSLSASNVNRATSEHFQIVWGNDNSKGLINDEFIKGNLYNLENCWDLYVDEMEMAEPSTSIYSWDTRQKYKVNLYIIGTGLKGFEEGWAFMSSADGFAYMFCDAEAMQNNPPSLVLPHEFGHVVTYHQKSWVGKDITGPWWESVANWFREQYMYSEYYEYNGTVYEDDSDFFEPYLRNLSLSFPHGRNYYQAWPYLQYLTENPDGFKTYGKDFVKRMMSEAGENEYPFDIVARLAPDTSIQDSLGYYARRMATFDFSEQAVYKKKLNTLIRDYPYFWQLIYTQPEPSKENDGWYRVPDERAPMQSGMNIIPLEIDYGIKSINVSFNGLSKVKGAGWRACVVMENSDGKTSYSEFFDEGGINMPVYGDVTSAYITVIATPDDLTPTSAFDKEAVNPFKSSLADTRYPYEIKLHGASIAQNPINTATAKGSYHSNGGGFVASSASVASSVYVGPNAKVLGSAKISGNVRIEDNAVVGGTTTIKDNAVISGHAMVWGAWWNGGVNISGNAKVSDYAVVAITASMSGNSRAIDSAFITESFKATDNATVKGLAHCYGEGSASGQAIIEGDYADNTNVTKGTAYGWTEGQEYADNLKYTDGLYSGYDFSADKGLLAWDKYACTDAILVNSPLWQSERTSAKGVLTFDGETQYAVVDRSLADLQNSEINFAVLWKGEDDEQKVFSFGKDKKCMYFTPCNADGKAEFVISDGNKTETLTAEAALTKGAWSVVRIILSDSGASKLIINGNTAVQENISLSPEDIAVYGGDYYIARGADGGYLNGSLDFFNVYYKEGTDIPYTYTATEEPDDGTPETIYGDVNCDGAVTSLDLVPLIAHFLGTRLTGQAALNADVVTDGNIALTDLATLKQFCVGDKVKLGV